MRRQVAQLLLLFFDQDEISKLLQIHSYLLKN